VASTSELATMVMMAHRGDGTARVGGGEGTARAQCAGAHDAKPSVGAKAKTLPFALAFVYLAAPTEAE
jgi:hypothetical protein